MFAKAGHPSPLTPRVAAFIVDEHNIRVSAAVPVEPVLGKRALPTCGDSILLRHPDFDSVCHIRVTAMSNYQIILM